MALWALPAVLLPLLIHLLSRNRAVRLKFGDNYLLKEAWRRAGRRCTLRDAGLLILRSLIMLALVLAAAGPIAGAPARPGLKAAEGERGKPLSLLLWVDGSYSMRYREAGRTRFEMAREAGLAVLAQLRPWDRAAVAVFSDRLEAPPPAWDSPREAARELRGAKPGFGTTDFSVPAKESSRFFKGAPGRRVALLLSDGARHGFRADPGALFASGLKSDGARILWLGLLWPRAANSFLARGRIEVGKGEAKALLRVAGLAWPAELSLWRDNAKIEAVRLSASRGEAGERIALPLKSLSGESRFRGRAALSRDNLPDDDEFYLSARLRSKPKVLCLYGNPDFLRLPRAGYFLKRLCGEAEGSLLGFQCDFMEMGRFDPASLGRYQAVLAADFSRLGPGAAESLALFVKGGGGLLLAPGEEAFDFGALAPLMPARAGPWVKAASAGIRPAGSLGSEAKSLWRGFDLGNVDLGSFRLLQASAGAEVLLRSADGYPLLAMRRAGAGAVALLAASLDADVGNLPLKPAFAPLMDKILGALYVPRPPVRNFEAVSGRPLTIAWDSSRLPGAVSITSPSGRAVKLWPDPATRSLSYAGCREPGFYALQEIPSGKRAAYACNLDRSSGESDLTPQPNPPWRRLRPAEASGDFRQAVYGKNMSAPSLGALLALLSLETLALVPWRKYGLFLPFFFFVFFSSPAAAAAGPQGGRFALTRLKFGPSWNLYSGAYERLLGVIGRTTSIGVEPEPRSIEISQPELFFSPLLLLEGSGEPPELSAVERKRLRDFLAAGGLLWISDVSGLPESPFDSWVRRTIDSLFPGLSLRPLPAESAVYKSFFLIRRPGGRVIVEPDLLGLSREGREAVIYSRNDVFGALEQDALGHPLYPCVPGGEAQRLDALKLAINVAVYSLTGNYKSDAVHQPFLLMKMRTEAHALP